MDSHLLSIVTFMPAVAALILAAFLRGEDAAAARNAKWLALITTTVTFLISLFILFDFDPTDTGFQHLEEAEWLLGMQYRLGVDGISILFVMLTTFMMPLVIAASWDVNTRVKEYMIAFLVLETLMLGVFMALDLVLFYLLFEAGLIPMFLIIGIWGGKERIYASFKFFLYTFLGSVLMLVAMVAMFAESGTTDPAVGACTCASGNQVCTGHIGILTAKLAKNARNISVCMPPTTVTPAMLKVSDANVWVSRLPSQPPMQVVPASENMATIATSINTDPRNV